MNKESKEPKEKKKRGVSSALPLRRPLPDEAATEINSGQIPTDYDEFFDKQTESDLKKLEEFQGMFGGQQYYVRVERYNKEENEMEIVERVLFDNFDPYSISKRYGGGRFIFTILNPRGKYVEGARFHFNFAKMVEPAGPVAPPDPLANPSVALLIESMKNQQSMLVEILKTSLTGEKQTPIDQLVGALKGLHEMNPKPKEESSIKNLKELLEIQAMLEDARGGRDEGGSGGIMSDVKEALKILGESKNFLRPQQPASEATTPIMGNVPIIKKSTPVLSDQTKTEAKPTMDPVISKIRFYLPEFENAAKEGADTGKWASFLLEVLESQIVPLLVKKYWGLVNEEEIWDKLVSAASEPSKVAKIYDYSPTLAEYREWVETLIKKAVSEFEGGTDDAVSLGSELNGTGG